MMRRLDARDANEVNDLMRDPSVYPHLIDDSCPPPEEYDAAPILADSKIYILGWFEDSKLVGLWLGYPLNGITYQTHICISEGYRGGRVVRASIRAVRWMFDNSPCRKLVIFVPDCSTTVKIIAKAIGFEREGRLKNSFLRNGVLMDEIIYGLEKGGGE